MASNQYRVVSTVWMGGGVQSVHRTLAGAQRAVARADRAVRHLNRHGGTNYHDCRIEERGPDGWRPLS